MSRLCDGYIYVYHFQDTLFATDCAKLHIFTFLIRAIPRYQNGMSVALRNSVSVQKILGAPIYVELFRQSPVKFWLRVFSNSKVNGAPYWGDNLPAYQWAWPTGTICKSAYGRCELGPVT